MAGYSGTPLSKKLGIKEGFRLRVLEAPPAFEDFLESLPADVMIARDAGGAAQIWVLFATRSVEFERLFAMVEPRVERGHRLWVAWPKKAAKLPTDLSFDVVQAFGLGLGLVDVKVCAIDDVWTGLCFMRRKA